MIKKRVVKLVQKIKNTHKKVKIRGVGEDNSITNFQTAC